MARRRAIEGEAVGSLSYTLPTAPGVAFDPERFGEAMEKFFRRFGEGELEESAYCLYDEEMEDAFEDLFGDDAFEEDSWCEAEGWVGDGHGETFEPKAVRPRTYYYHPDHLGSTSLVSSETGAVTESVAYFPYGEVWRDQGRSPTEYRFTSKPYDAETGLMYFGARYYQPGFGRWLAVDPAAAMRTEVRRGKAAPRNPPSGEQLSVFSYGSGSPITKYDPDGMDVRVAGTRQEKSRLVQFIKRTTGLPVKIGAGSNLIEIVGARNAGQGSARAAHVLEMAVKSQDTVDIALIRNVAGVMVDSYFTLEVDLGDLEGLETRSTRVAALAFAHVVSERSAAIWARRRGGAASDIGSKRSPYTGGLAGVQ